MEKSIIDGYYHTYIDLSGLEILDGSLQGFCREICAPFTEITRWHENDERIGWVLKGEVTVETIERLWLVPRWLRYV